MPCPGLRALLAYGVRIAALPGLPGEADFLPVAVLGSATDLRLLLLQQGLTGKAFHEGGAETCGLLSFRVTINKFYMFARAEARLLRRLHG